MLTNCIVYYNSSYTIGDNYFGDTFNYFCATPDSGSGAGNITNEPVSSPRFYQLRVSP